MRHGSTIELFSRAGVLVNLAEADVSNSTIQGDRSFPTQGIGARGSQVMITDCEIFECQSDAIELADEASAGIINCDIHDATVGVRMTSSSAANGMTTQTPITPALCPRPR